MQLWFDLESDNDVFPVKLPMFCTSTHIHSPPLLVTPTTDTIGQLTDQLTDRKIITTYFHDFSRFKCRNLMPFFQIYHSKVNIFGFFGLQNEQNKFFLMQVSTFSHLIWKQIFFFEEIFLAAWCLLQNNENQNYILDATTVFLIIKLTEIRTRDGSELT